MIQKLPLTLLEEFLLLALDDQTGQLYPLALNAYDFLPLTPPNLIALFGKADAAATQPITYAHAGLPPMLLLHGDKDTEVLPRNSINMTAKLKSFHDPVTFITYPGFDHIDIVLALANGFRDKGPVLNDIDAFIKENMR